MFALYDRNQSCMPICMDDLQVTWIQALVQSHGSTWGKSWIPHSTLWNFFWLLGFRQFISLLYYRHTWSTSRSRHLFYLSFFFLLWFSRRSSLVCLDMKIHSLLSGSFFSHYILLKIWTDCTSNKLGEDLPVLAHITGSWPKRFCLLSAFFHHRVDWHASFSGMVTLSIDLSKHLETVELKWRFV